MSISPFIVDHIKLVFQICCRRLLTEWLRLIFCAVMTWRHAGLETTMGGSSQVISRDWGDYSLWQSTAIIIMADQVRGQLEVTAIEVKSPPATCVVLWVFDWLSTQLAKTGAQCPDRIAGLCLEAMMGGLFRHQGLLGVVPGWSGQWSVVSEFSYLRVGCEKLHYWSRMGGRLDWYVDGRTSGPDVYPKNRRCVVCCWLFGNIVVVRARVSPTGRQGGRVWKHKFELLRIS